MAIYSFNHATFGKTTHKPGAAAANVKYNADLSKTQMDEFLRANRDYLEEHGEQRTDEQIEAHLAELRHGRTPIGNAVWNAGNELVSTASENVAYNAREEAAYAVISHIIPKDPNEAASWFLDQEKNDRKNARMSDRFIGALPRELTPEQNLEAIENFCRGVTKDRIPWHASLHLELDQKEQPDWNPHAHIIFRDRDIETGRRYLYTSAGAKERHDLAEKDIECWSTSKLREAWQVYLNDALERAGHKERVDHRTLKEQGIDREPQIHVGPKSKRLKEKGQNAKSRDLDKNGYSINYTDIDEGLRADHNERIKKGERKVIYVSRYPEIAKLAKAQAGIRKEMYREQKRDRDVLRDAQAVRLAEHRKWMKELDAQARKDAKEEVKAMTQERWDQARHISSRAERNEAMSLLKLHSKVLYHHASNKKIAELAPLKQKEWNSLVASFRKERLALRDQHREQYKALDIQHRAEVLMVRTQIHKKEVLQQKNRIQASLGNAKMPNQQKAAIRFMQNHDKAVTVEGLSKALFHFAKEKQVNFHRITANLHALRQRRLLEASHSQRHRAQAGNAMTGITHDNSSSENRSRNDPHTEHRLDYNSPAGRRAIQMRYFQHAGNEVTAKPRDRGGGGRGR